MTHFVFPPVALVPFQLLEISSAFARATGLRVAVAMKRVVDDKGGSKAERNLVKDCITASGMF